MTPPKGMVYLVGAGPGDSQLITLKGMKCIQKADVIIYDYLANEELLRWKKPEAEVVYVGKRGSSHTLEQKEINNLIVQKAQEGKVVVRLKGGDPFVFGRGAEEALALASARVPFEVVPGVTAAVAAAAYAGIPVTHRQWASILCLITGQEDPSKEESAIDYESLAHGAKTLAFYMGFKNLPFIIENLMKAGMDPKTPIALIQWGTLPRQRTLVGTLENILSKATQEGMGPPVIALIGKVVGLRSELNWFETRPLFGRRILITRSREQASTLKEMLEDHGAEVIEFPTIRIAPIQDFSLMDRAIENLPSYHWLVFTSVNGVEAFFQRLFSLGKDLRALASLKLCAIGPATAEAIENYHLKVDLKPQKYLTEALVEEFALRGNLKGQRFLLPRADKARSLLPDELVKMGAEVDDVVAYQTLQEEAMEPEVVEKLIQGSISVVCFTSSSTVKNFCKTLKRSDLEKMASQVQFASIGPITSQTMREEGLSVSIEAREHTIPGLVEAILQALSPGGKPLSLEKERGFSPLNPPFQKET